MDDTVYEPIRRARPSTLIRFIAVHFTLTAIVNLVFFAGNTFRPLASATGGLLTGSLVANLTFIGVLVVLIIMRYGGLRLYDLGVIPRQIPVAIGYTLGFWGLAQIIHLIAGLLHYGHVVISPDWNNSQYMVGVILMQIFGNALFEEIAYRGFLFPQLFLRFASMADRPGQRVALAILISQGLFALSHIPNRIYLGMTPNAIALDLLMLLGWGTLYTLIYLKTDNLFVVVGVHALGNAPITLFASVPLLTGAGASILIYTLVIIVLFVWPLLRKHWRGRWATETEAVYGETAG